MKSNKQNEIKQNKIREENRKEGKGRKERGAGKRWKIFTIMAITMETTGFNHQQVAMIRRYVVKQGKWEVNRRIKQGEEYDPR